VRKIIYFIVEAVRGFYQAKLMTFVSIMTIAATLFLICGVFIALMNIDEILNKAGDARRGGLPERRRVGGSG